MPKITVGILTRDRKEMALRAIASCFTQGIKDLEVVVVVVNSQDGTYEAVREKFPQVKLIRIPRNLGCPGGRNHVYANSSGDYIVNLDDDAYLGEGALRRLIETFQSDPSIGIISMGVRYIEKYDASEPRNEKWYEVGCFRGTASAVRKKMIDEIGDYPHDYFLYHEEQHLSIRAMSAGYKIVQRLSSFVWHPFIAGGAGTRLDFYRYRNTMLIVIDLFPGWYMVKYLFLRVGSNALVSLRRGTFYKYLAAVASVLWRLPRILIKRQPCSAEAVKKYFRLRSVGQKQGE